MRTAWAAAIACALIVGGAVWRSGVLGRAPDALELYGNVDLRQVELSFNGSERVAEVIAQEGEHVKRGQVLARLETNRLRPQVAAVEAQLAAQQQVVNRMHNGSRPEEIAQARANVASVQAEANDRRAQNDRLKFLAQTSAGRAVSRQDADRAQAASDAAQARLALAQSALTLASAGPRKEDIGEAEAHLRACAANLALLEQTLADADLLAPVDAVVRSRTIEPGELASPQRAAFSLAIVDPKWVRAYVDEANLGRVVTGAQARISVDSFKHKSFAGRIGFISPSAEFTPKSVQTEALRSSLVYEVRVFVQDPADELRLGMPATVHLQPDRR